MMMYFSSVGLSVFFLNSIFLCFSYTFKSKVYVELNQGIIFGIQSQSINGRQFASFYSLPYAQPPLGNFRFQDPVEFSDWRLNQIVNATFHGPVCPQWDVVKEEFVGNEDCLFLNVFTPKISLSNSEDKSQLSVLVFVHGGLGFSSGGTKFYGPRILMNENHVLVTVQYRLGVLGFLSSKSNSIPGNFGILDVLLALKWVKKNIKQFGGDPNRVTLMGHGSGGAIVSLLIASPLAKGLFMSAIIHSGSCFCDWAIQENPRIFLRNLAFRLNCLKNVNDVVDEGQLLKCLRDVPTSDLVSAHHKFSKSAFFPVFVAPVIDGWRENPVLPHHPKLIYDRHQENPVALLVGETTHEGLYLFRALEIKLNKNKCSMDDDDVNKLFRVLLTHSLDDNFDFDDLWNSFRQIYFTDVFSCDQFVPAVIEFLGDLSISTCMDDLVRIHSKSAVTYYYVFGLRNYSTLQHPLLTQIRDQLDAITQANLRLYFNGVSCHGDDVAYLFDIDHSLFFPSSLTFDNFTLNILRLWSGFVNHGHFNWMPFRYKRLNLPQWPIFNETDQKYLHFSASITVRSRYRHRQKTTWRLLLSKSRQKLIEQKILDSCKDPYFTLTWIFLTTTIIAFLGVLTIYFSVVRKSKKPRKG